MSIDNLNGIQWQPGAGASRDPLDWVELIKRIQARNKKVLVYCPPERVKPLLDRIDRQRVYLYISCPDEAAAHACLTELDQLGA